VPSLLLSDCLLYTVFVKKEKKNTTDGIDEAAGQVWSQLFRTTEGRILLLGIAVALAGLIIMGVLAFWSPETSQMFGTMTLFNIIFGRAVSMSIGYAGGYGHTFVVPINMWVETVLVLLFYPIFVFSMRKLVVFPKLKKFLDRTNEAAERHYDKVHRYGIIGLFVFVWFPFWMTGPVVGSAIGFLLGFPAWLTMSVVLTGTYIAMIGWAYVMFGIYSKAAIIGPWAPVLVIVLLILLVIAGQLLSRRGKDQQAGDNDGQNEVNKQLPDDKTGEHE
jgi:uncharacterized membrane protein